MIRLAFTTPPEGVYSPIVPLGFQLVTKICPHASPWRASSVSSYPLLGLRPPQSPTHVSSDAKRCIEIVDFRGIAKNQWTPEAMPPKIHQLDAAAKPFIAGRSIGRRRDRRRELS